MESTHKNVKKWLESVFDNEPIPSFEVNPNTLEALTKLANLSQESQKDEIELQNLFKIQITEYKGETKRIKDRMNILEVNVESTVGLIDKFLDILANISDILDLDDPSFKDILMSIFKVQQDAANIPLKDLENHRKRSEYLEENLQLAKKITSVNKLLTNCEKQKSQKEQNISQTKKKLQFIKEKQREYTKTLQQGKATLQKSGLEKELRHEMLCEMKAKLIELEEILQPLRMKLNGYRVLPPNLELAQVKVAESEKELSQLTQSLETEVSNICI